MNNEALQIAQEQLARIRALVAATQCDYTHADALPAAANGCADLEEARLKLERAAFSVDVRTGWHTTDTGGVNEEYRVDVCLVGARVWVTGELDEGQPQTACLMYMGHTPRMFECPTDDHEKRDLLSFAQAFIFN